MNEQIIKDSFKPLINELAWNVKKGHGSFLTFEFGTPNLEIGEPKIWKTLPFPSNEHPTRQTTVRGDFHLWIYCCNWKIQIKDKQIAFEESSDEEIQKATEYLNGQKLVSIVINTKTARTIFKFDLGGELLTFNQSYEPETEIWMLYMPKNILIFNNLGQFCLIDKDEDVKEEKFVTVESELININTT